MNQCISGRKKVCTEQQELIVFTVYSKDVGAVKKTPTCLETLKKLSWPL